MSEGYDEGYVRGRWTATQDILNMLQMQTYVSIMLTSGDAEAKEEAIFILHRVRQSGENYEGGTK